MSYRLCECVRRLNNCFNRRHYSDSFINGSSIVYIEQLYVQWKSNAATVHSSWDAYFKLIDQGVPSEEAYRSPFVIKGARTAAAAAAAAAPAPLAKPKPQTAAPAVQVDLAVIENHLHVFHVIELYQTMGHLSAALDPLFITRAHMRKRPEVDKDAILKSIPSDPSVKYELPDITFIGGREKTMSLKEIVEKLDKSYCQSIGVEMHHVTKPEKLHFMREYMEMPNKVTLSNQQKKIALKRLGYAHNFEYFLSKKWPSEKRFGLEGGESYVPAMKHIIEIGSDLGAEYFVLGMAHRGRLNTLANVMEKSLVQLFSHFQPLDPKATYGGGDVKYHLGATTEVRHSLTGKTIRISMCTNASHLESVNPIVIGKTAGHQVFSDDVDKSKNWPILIHGDAAFCGQGVVYETFHLSELLGYNTGGTVHVVINNQIGFTTDPVLSRSSEYCTAVAKVISCPILHVNGDDVEAVLFAAEVASRYRQQFKCDIVIDIVCYRRYGHNEVDEPMFTQPHMYQVIKKMTPVYQQYRAKLISEKVISEDEVKSYEDEHFKLMEASYQEASKVTKLNPDDWFSSPWSNFFLPHKDPNENPSTGIEEEVLKKILVAISTPPANFNLHNSLARILKNRGKMLEKGVADWAMGESLAFASLLQEGTYVRLSGQDVERGTFSHRHHILHDQVNGKKLNILKNIFPNMATYSICNSSLSETGVMGFEFGMSLVNPRALIMWEAQFGDFANSATIIIDQYLSSGEGKWYRNDGVVLLLPHGLEGQGPEHSSARPERYLQQCNDDDSELIMEKQLQLRETNWIIASPSTPASLFHVLRRQMKLNFRKPMIIFTPKALLRLPECVSKLTEFIGQQWYKAYLPDTDVTDKESVKKLILCTGKVYYELHRRRKEKSLEKDIAIGRIEQICPLPYADIYPDVMSYPNAQVYWVQEEHKNQGCWNYVSPRLNKLIGKEKGSVTYIGRAPSCTPATGHGYLYRKELEHFLTEATAL